MKQLHRIAVLMLLLAALSGCSWMDGSYVSVTPHQVGYYQTDDDLFAVRNFSQLRNALTALIDSGSEEGIITLVDYPEGQAESDMESAMRYASEQYPIGAYAVEAISWEHGSSGQGVISVRIDYRRSKAELDQIHSIRGMENAKIAISDALSTCQPSLVLQISGYTDTDFVQFVEDYSNLHPDRVMEQPLLTVKVYPDSGSVRILDLHFAYQTSRDSLRYMRTKVAPVFASAALYVSPEAGDAVKLSQLCSFLMQRFDYTIQPSITPAYSLLGYGIGDSRAFANVYGAMCRQVGLEAMTVSGTCDGQSRFWNIVRCGDTYYHVDLLRSRVVRQFQLFTDAEMSHYVWDYSAYPACGTPLPAEVPETIPASPIQTVPETIPGRTDPTEEKNQKE